MPHAPHVPLLHRAATPQLHDFLEHSAARWPDQVALVAEHDRLTYAELDARANGLAHALVQDGVGRGERVVVHGDNTADVVIGFWAALKANAVVCLVSGQTKADRLEHVLNDTRASVLLTHMDHARVVHDAVARAPHLNRVLAAGAFDRRRLAPVQVAASWDEALERGLALAQAGANGAAVAGGPPARRNLDIDLAAIVYTSAEDDEPLGVMLSHRNMLTAATSVSTYLELSEHDVVLDALPLAFHYGLYELLMAARVGARLVLERGFSHPAELLTRLAQERVTGLPGVPAMFASLSDLKSLGDYDLSALRFVTTSAATLPLKHVARLRELFPQVKLYSMYGLTECSCCTYVPPEDLDRKPASVGLAIPDTEVWLVNDHDHRVAPGALGQLVVRGATVMQGYWGKPDESARRLRPGPLPGERVLYTGDLCRIDDEGFVTFVGRISDLIVSGGQKVPPKLVECAIANLPGVREVAVIGVPDELLGQAVKAFVVLEEGATLTARDVLRECQQQLEPHLLPREVEFRGALPLSPNGKVRKGGLA